MRSREAGAQPAFPPNVVVEVKRIACERPMDAGVPLARWSLPDLRREVLTRGIVATVSGTTLWRWLDADAIRPWRHRSWLFPRDSRFAELAGPILDLYVGRWDGRPLGLHDFVISADEKTSIQARHRRHGTMPVAPGRAMRVEHDYRRRGAWAYVAAWDIHRARLFGRCEARSGIAAFDRLVDQVMTQEPYRSARRVFWVMDNGSAHRGAKGDAPCSLAYAGAGSHAAPCQLAQPDRNLFLHRATEGPDPERFRELGHTGALSDRLSTSLSGRRAAIPLDLYPRGPAAAPYETRDGCGAGTAGRMRHENTSP
jgi:hypothetical protein